MAANLERAGASREMIDTALVWANDLDNVLKRRGREMLAVVVPHAVMAVFEDTHHWLHPQHPQRVIETIDDFLGDAFVR